MESCDLRPLRTSDVNQTHDNVMEGVRQHIIDAEVVIAVITDVDANVMYELGLAHAAKKKAIMLLEKGKQPPSAFSHIRVLFYDPEDFPLSRDELSKSIRTSRQTTHTDDLFPELPIRTREDLLEYEYLKQTRKTLTIKVTPGNCSIFFNSRFLGKSPQTIRVNPEADRNIVSISATEHFEHYQVLTEKDLEKGELKIDMEPRHEEKYPIRVNFWLMKRREDPDNPVLSLAICNYLLGQCDYDSAKKEAQFCISKVPQWFAGYNMLGVLELNDDNYEKAKYYFRTVSDLNTDDWIVRYNIACVESRAGNFDAAIDELGKIINSPALRESYRQNYQHITTPLIEIDPDFEPLRKDPKCKGIFAKIVQEFKEIATAPEPPLITEASTDKKQDETHSPLPYTIKQFSIENYQCIMRVDVRDIPVDCPWIFITGENGDGKTSLLQALTIGLYGVKDADDLIHDNECKIDVETQENGDAQIRHFFWETDHWKTIGPAAKDRAILKSAGNVLAYGPARLSIQGELSMDAERDQYSPVYGMLYQSGNLRNIEHWLKEQLLEGGAGGDLHDKNALSRITKVKELLISLMPNVSEIIVEGKDIFYREKGHKVPAHHLSAGHKSILAMIGDMLIRLFESQPDVTDPRELRGIVIIDELDTHLHPKWEVEFPRMLSKTFPLVQFIASTHSVIPFMGAPEGSLFLRVTRDEVHGTQVERLDIDVANLLPNALLTSPLFDLGSIVNRQNKDFSRVHTEDDYNEIKRQKKRDKKLEESASEGDQFPKEYFR